MIVVIQCAARKRPDAGYFTETWGRVFFVAQPDQASALGGAVYRRPDDLAEPGRTWRDELIAYNSNPDGNPRRLLPAYELYLNEAYRKLAEKVGLDKLFILSAGWGLISATFLTPPYDITFSAQAESYKRRRMGDRYRDFSMLPPGTQEPILFFGGKDYLPLFNRLTSGVQGERIVFFNSMHAPQIDGGRAIRFKTTTRTNWHYECVDAFLSGALEKEIG